MRILYRAVSLAERADALQNGLRSAHGSLEGKWLAENRENAIAWGQRLYNERGELFRVLAVELPDAVIADSFRLPLLDNIGPAVFVEVRLLMLCQVRQESE